MTTLKTLALATTALLAPLAAVAQDAPAAPAAGAAQQLQWHGVDVTAEQFQPMVDFAANVLGLTPVTGLSTDNLAVFAHPNGSLFEIYGPGDVGYAATWREQGAAVGFAVDDIDAVTAKALEAGLTQVDELVAPGMASDGSDYIARFFRAPDGRIYSVSQTSGYTASEAAGEAASEPASE